MSSQIREGNDQSHPLQRSQELELIRDLKRIRTACLRLEARVDLRQFGLRRQSARNLLHYVALRQHDIREIQEKLALMGISSLGRSESHVLYNLNAALEILQSVAGVTNAERLRVAEVTPAQGNEILQRNADRLFGPRQAGRTVRMMVTMPSEAATSYELVRDLLAEGMDCMRINCAHDNETSWLGMIRNLRKARRELGRKCRTLMDIGGPKLRTGKLEPGPQVLRLRPARDIFGNVTSPGRAALFPEGGKRPLVNESTLALEVDADWLRELEDKAKVRVVDARGAKRSLTASQGTRAVSLRWKKTIYIDSKTRLSVKKNGKSYSTPILNIPFAENPIILRIGDTLVLTASPEPGKPRTESEPARISCTLPEALRFVKSGQSVWLDDGKIGGIVRSASANELRIEVTRAAPEGAKLGGDKGISLPDTDLRLPPLTQKDQTDLQFIVDHADNVGYSFVAAPEDLRVLRSKLAGIGGEKLGIILKIETKRAFEQLPSLLLEAMRGPATGVMIARGDLAVECGYERLAEVQEEILWMCEAAHMPTIWATQVLEGLTKNGVPSRAEVTDAAMGERSECVMLNKGPHVVEALRALDNILRRMQAHQVKKRSMMRQLSIADSFYRTATEG